MAGPFFNSLYSFLVYHSLFQYIDLHQPRIYPSKRIKATNPLSLHSRTQKNHILRILFPGPICIRFTCGIEVRKKRRALYTFIFWTPYVYVSIAPYAYPYIYVFYTPYVYIFLTPLCIRFMYTFSYSPLRRVHYVYVFLENFFLLCIRITYTLKIFWKIFSSSPYVYEYVYEYVYVLRTPPLFLIPS